MSCTPLPLWKRNLIGIAVVAAALTIYTVTNLWPPWALYQQTLRPAHVVDARQSQTFDGQTWSIGQVRHLSRNPTVGAPALPKGTVLSVVTVNRSGEVPAGQSCIGVLSDGERRWRDQTLGPYGAPTAKGAGFNCTKPGPLQWSFLLPKDVVPTSVDVMAPNGAILVRLQL